jgi:hypothetical protein
MIATPISTAASLAAQVGMRPMIAKLERPVCTPLDNSPQAASVGLIFGVGPQAPALVDGSGGPFRIHPMHPAQELQDVLSAETNHLAVGGPGHWHIVIALPDPNNAEPLEPHKVSAPYGSEALANGDARKFRELAIGALRHYRLGVLPCTRACPPSSIADFGWPSS